MVEFQVVGTFSDAPLHFVSGITDLDLVAISGGYRLYTTTRAGGGMMAFNLTSTAMTVLDQLSISAGYGVPAYGQLDQMTIAGQSAVLVMGASGARLSGLSVAANGSFGAAVQVPGTVAGSIASQTSLALGGQTFVYVNKMGNGDLLGYRMLPDGSAVEVEDLAARGDYQGVDVRAMTSAVVGGVTYLLALSTSSEGLRSFRVQADGGLVAVSSLGAAGGLGISAPSAIETVQLGARTFALVAAAGSSSISVIEVTAAGRLTLSDHIIDTLDTRFQGVQAMTSVTMNDRVLIFAGGGDQGISLLTLLPDGKLLLLDQQLAMQGLKIDNITALAASVSGGKVDLYIAGEGAGIIRLRVDPGPLAAPIMGGTANNVLNGGASNDVASGLAGADSLYGGAGDDILMDGTGTDELYGGAGADIFVMAADGESDTIRDFQIGIDRIDLTSWGRIYSLDALTLKARGNGHLVITHGTETLTIVQGNGQPLPASAMKSSDLFGLWHLIDIPVYEGLRLEGSAQGDSLIGNGGEDTLVGSTGADWLDGKGGFDFIDYSAAPAGLISDLVNTGINSGMAGGDRYASIEGIIGSAFGDTISGTVDDNFILGGAGNDVLSGRYGKDTLKGGSGDDTLNGGDGADRLYGGTGRDTARYLFSTAPVRVDLLYPDFNRGEAAGDLFSSIEDLGGGNYADLLAGDDLANRIWGESQSDRLYGRGGNDSLYGGAGYDILQGDAGDDLLDGGTSADTAVFATSQKVQVNLNMQGPQNTGLGLDTLISIENLVGGSNGDWLVGNGLGNQIYGEAGNDTIYGGAGNDSVLGGQGNDLLSGGDGTDALFFTGDSPIRLALYLKSAQNTLQGIDTISGFEWVYGGTGNDVIAGDALSNVLSGGGGNDKLYGNTGNDRLFGGDGNDILYGGSGNDSLYGGAGIDLLTFGGTKAVNLSLSRASSQPTPEGRDLYLGFEYVTSGYGNDVLGGNAAGNRLNAQRGNDTLNGYAGNDTLIGGSGRDLLWGDKGNDFLIGGPGIDTAIFTGRANARVTLTAPGYQSTGYGVDRLIEIENLTSGAGSDRLYGNSHANLFQSGSGKDTLDGRSGNDTLMGSHGNDRIYGGNGRDRIVGGTGSDTLTGGAGADAFVFSGGRDLVTDFHRTQFDRILLDDADLHMIRGMGSAKIVSTYGHDLGTDVTLNFGGGHVLYLDNVSSLSQLNSLLYVI